MDDHGVAARGEAVLRHQLNETRSVAKKMLTELEDAGRTESRVRGLLGEARRRLKELAVTVPVADLQRNATHALDGAMAASLAGGGGARDRDEREDERGGDTGATQRGAPRAAAAGHRPFGHSGRDGGSSPEPAVV